MRLSVPMESNGGVPVNMQDQTSRMLDLDFIQAKGVPTTLISDVSAGDTTIDVTAVAGFVAGTVVGLTSSLGTFYFGRQVGAIAGNTVTLDTPLDNDFTTAGTNVLAAIDNMNISGSLGTPQVFQIGPFGTSGLEIDITRIHGYIQDGSAMDDALFGGITALANGIVLRINDGYIQNIWNAKTNGRLALITGGDFTYTASAPAGSEGARFRNTFAGQEKHGVTVRLGAGDILELLVQDNLTGLEVFSMMAQGHFVTD